MLGRVDLPLVQTYGRLGQHGRAVAVAHTRGRDHGRYRLGYRTSHPDKLLVANDHIAHHHRIAHLQVGLTDAILAHHRVNDAVH